MTINEIIIIWITVSPDVTAGTLICGTPPDALADSNMVLDSANLPDLMCIGETATYDCSTTGLNVREVRRLGDIVNLVTSSFWAISFISGQPCKVDVHFDLQR